MTTPTNGTRDTMTPARAARLALVGVFMLLLPGTQFIVKMFTGQPWQSGELFVHFLWVIGGLCLFDYKGARMLMGKGVDGIRAWRGRNGG